MQLHDRKDLRIFNGPGGLPESMAPVHTASRLPWEHLSYGSCHMRRAAVMVRDGCS